MSLTARDIEAALREGFGCGDDRREFVAKLDPLSDNVTFNEMTRLARASLSIDYVMDLAHADENGSDIIDHAALRQFLGRLAVRVG